MNSAVPYLFTFTVLPMVGFVLAMLFPGPHSLRLGVALFALVPILFLSAFELRRPALRRAAEHAIPLAARLRALSAEGGLPERLEPMRVPGMPGGRYVLSIDAPGLEDTGDSWELRTNASFLFRSLAFRYRPNESRMVCRRAPKACLHGWVIVDD